MCAMVPGSMVMVTCLQGPILEEGDGDGELFRDALVRDSALSRLINKWIF